MKSNFFFFFALKLCLVWCASSIKWQRSSQETWDTQEFRQKTSPLLLLKLYQVIFQDDGKKNYHFGYIKEILHLK